MRKKIRKTIVLDGMFDMPWDYKKYVSKKFHKVRKKVLAKISKTGKYGGTLTCPKCGGTLCYAMESFNFSIHVKCKTKNCINWFEGGK